MTLTRSLVERTSRSRRVNNQHVSLGTANPAMTLTRSLVERTSRSRRVNNQHVSLGTANPFF
jgi:hypothetical protein